MSEPHLQQTAKPTDTDQSSNPVRDAIAEAIRENRVLLFMKGTPEQPSCGFSARTVAALQTLGTPFAAVDVLPDPRIRQELSALSQWPTVPQLFIEGELIGGCDIVTEMYESGELASALGVEPAEVAGPPGQGPGPESSIPPGSGAGPAPLPVENRLG
jgi:monothiol glutaredoxin